MSPTKEAWDIFSMIYACWFTFDLIGIIFNFEKCENEFQENKANAIANGTYSKRVPWAFLLYIMCCYHFFAS